MFIYKVWYGPGSIRTKIVQVLLLPLTVLFMMISSLRLYLYKRHLLKNTKINVPVIIVGGITVGGAGKTPVSIALIDYLNQQGIKVGVISRGYKGHAPYYPFEVKADSKSSESGDEPLLIKLQTGDRAVVVTDPVRSRGAKYLEQAGCEVIICDDGLQHYALNRSIEIIVLDSERLWGNGLCLPAGPLREGVWRLNKADFLILNGKAQLGFDNFVLKPNAPKSLTDGTPLQSKKIIALAGIANPERFYRTCEGLGLEIVDKIELLDHAMIDKKKLLEISSGFPVVMTAKDAVKYRHLGINNLYVLDVKAELSAEFLQKFWSRIKEQQKKLSYKL